ncbi:MAG: peptidase M4 [Alphaproteobacteria bacterium]|jgi:uncharacterized membrane protein YkoI
MIKVGFVFLAVVLIFLAQPLVAANHEQDSALQAFQSGEVAGLPRILARARSAFFGRVLAVELIRKLAGNAASPWVYMVKMLTPQGNVIMLYLNAKTAAIQSVKGRGADAARKQ